MNAGDRVRQLEDRVRRLGESSASAAERDPSACFRFPGHGALRRLVEVEGESEMSDGGRRGWTDAPDGPEWPAARVPTEPTSGAVPCGACAEPMVRAEADLWTCGACGCCWCAAALVDLWVTGEHAADPGTGTGTGTGAETAENGTGNGNSGAGHGPLYPLHGLN